MFTIYNLQDACEMRLQSIHVHVRTLQLDCGGLLLRWLLSDLKEILNRFVLQRRSLNVVFLWKRKGFVKKLHLGVTCIVVVPTSTYTLRRFDFVPRNNVDQEVELVVLRDCLRNVVFLNDQQSFRII